MNQPQSLDDRQILTSWRHNATPWTAAVRSGSIESRVQVTDQAVVAAVLAQRPRTVLDLGCGEGWLSRALAAHAIEVIGIDATHALVEQARAAGGGRFLTLTYEEIASGALTLSFDVVVSNFALLGEHAVERLMAAIPRLLTTGGRVIVQTLHPVVACGDAPYRDGWREGSWAGFGPEFSEPAPWYFRRLESWVRLLVASGLQLVELMEPLHPVSGRPASVILVGQRA